MITRETEVDISYFNRQGLSYREMGAKFGHDRRTVKKYAENPELIGKLRKSAPRPSKLDEFKSQIEDWLEDDPKYKASWILDRLRKLGYSGGRTIVSDLVQILKEENRRIAYIRFETDPGRQGQVDFGDFKVVMPDGSEKTYYLFSMVLGYSRGIYSEYLDKCDMVSFLDAHQRAFRHLGGVPAEILYDRMRNVFIRKLSGKAQFTQGLMTLANHYGFTPEVAPAYSPWVKGKIERPMDFIREGFWRGYVFTDCKTANLDLLQWLSDKAERIHGTTREKVSERHEREKEFLMSLPPSPCDVSLRLYRKVHKDCTISVDGSGYEVPHKLVGKKIVIRMKDGILRVYDGDTLMATLTESEQKGKLVRFPGLAEAIRADWEMNARKYTQPKKGKGKATISPALGKYQVDVERRSLDIYRQIGGGVSYA
ncbi:MAG TPA: IS21 family transposase [Dissulfurispiraceae bacterium]|nr:IS21 family transposase [Dissulfurispiraceae bacterium]